MCYILNLDMIKLDKKCLINIGSRKVNPCTIVPFYLKLYEIYSTVHYYVDEAFYLDSSLQDS